MTGQGLIAAMPGTLAVYACAARREWATRAVLAYRWEDALDGGGWVECVGSGLGLGTAYHLAKHGWEYAGLSHLDDWWALTDEMKQAGLDTLVEVMTPVQTEESPTCEYGD